MAEWLSRNLGVAFDVRVAESYSALRQAVREGLVDVAWVPPSICAEVEGQDVGVFKAIRHGRATYCSAIVTRRDVEGGLEGLRGKRAAWVDPMSIGGYQLAAAHMRRNGIEPDEDLARQEFLGAYGAALRAVLDDRADIAAMYCNEAREGLLARCLHEVLGPASAALTLVAFTLSVPIDALIVCGGARNRDLDMAAFRAVFDGSRGHTFFLSLLEADRLVPAEPGEYAALRL